MYVKLLMCLTLNPLNGLSNLWICVPAIPQRLSAVVVLYRTFHLLADRSASSNPAGIIRAAAAATSATRHQGSPNYPM